MQKKNDLVEFDGMPGKYEPVVAFDRKHVCSTVADGDVPPRPGDIAVVERFDQPATIGTLRRGEDGALSLYDCKRLRGSQISESRRLADLTLRLFDPQGAILPNWGSERVESVKVYRRTA